MGAVPVEPSEQREVMRAFVPWRISGAQVGLASSNVRSRPKADV